MRIRHCHYRDPQNAKKLEISEFIFMHNADFEYECRFGDIIFRVFDKDAIGGSLNYHELLLALWCFIQKGADGNLNENSNDELEDFTFQVYELSEEGFLSIEYEGEWGRMSCIAGGNVHSEIVVGGSKDRFTSICL